MEKNKLLVIPAINCSTRICAEARLAATEAMGAEWIHVDVTDGIFSTHPAWGDPETYAHTRAHIEVHLMVMDPESVIEAWLRAGAARIIVHVESILKNKEDVLPELMRACAAYHATLMLSAGPETSVETLLPFVTMVKAFQFLAVPPGFSGQPFDERTIAKVKLLRERAGDALIEVDGGIDPYIAAQVRVAGADIVTSTAFIWESKDPATAFQALMRA